MVKFAILSGGYDCRFPSGRVVRIGEKFSIDERSGVIVSDLFSKVAMLVIGKDIAELRC